MSAVEEINQGVEPGSKCSQLPPRLPPPHCSLGSRICQPWLQGRQQRMVALGEKLRCGGCRFPRSFLGAAPVPGTPSHVPPPAPAAPGFPTVANRLNYFLISTR